MDFCWRNPAVRQVLPVLINGHICFQYSSLEALVFIQSVQQFLLCGDNERRQSIKRTESSKTE